MLGLSVCMFFTRAFPQNRGLDLVSSINTRVALEGIGQLWTVHFICFFFFFPSKKQDDNPFYNIPFSGAQTWRLGFGGEWHSLRHDVQGRDKLVCEADLPITEVSRKGTSVYPSSSCFLKRVAALCFLVLRRAHNW